MSFNRYYHDELTYLRELGAEFALENPNLAPFLSREAADPDIERLIEAFAFLTARIRQKIDDELPELSHSLVALMWPNLLRPLPSMSVLEFEPVPGALTSSQVVAAGAEFLAEPIDGTACSFRGTRAAAVHPITVTQASFEVMGGRSRLQVTLMPTAGARLEELRLDPLSFYLNFDRDSPTSRLLMLWLCRRLRRVTVDAGRGEVSLPPSAVRQGGFGEDDLMLPHQPQNFRGHALLQEYIAFPQKFLFFDLLGLGQAAPQPRREWVVGFEFDGIPDVPIRITAANLRVNCVPVVNLFGLEAVPIDVTNTKTEYRVLPAGEPAAHYCVFSIDQVSGWARSLGERRRYTAFEDFLHAIDDQRQSHAFYRTRLKPSMTRAGIDTFVSLVDETQSPIAREAEIVSMALTCTNAALAETVPIGGIRRATASSPTFARFRNIAQVSPQALPPLDVQLLWRVIANLSIAPGSLLDIGAIRSVVGSLDFAAVHDVRARRRLELRLESLKAVKSRATDLALHGGRLYRGMEIELDLDETRLGGTGEAFLLGSVLDAFFAEASNVNRFHRFAVRATDSNWRCDWPVRLGQGPLL
jgi:type VI secretion system protein ImpG